MTRLRTRLGFFASGLGVSAGASGMGGTAGRPSLIRSCSGVMAGQSFG